MNTANNIIEGLIIDLDRERNSVEETYRAARIEWDKARKRQNELLESDPYSQECTDACADVRAYFKMLQDLDDKSTALWGAVRKLKQAQEL